MSATESRLIDLPHVNPPQGNYLCYARTGSLVFVWPRPVERASAFKGVVGKDPSVESEVAARLCALNVLG
ncbi:hypothetical protein CDO27_34755 (plasmid) [Sinorhizobium meliloti]|nr:hypothetical protein CDO27_34755 [Sinorhizobium meliloti]CCM69720.1 hypothetical protein BN406_06783 [Sinorhizobium meliloti Rm41]